MQNSTNHVIKFLNRLGFIILEIEGNFFTVKHFEEASQNNWKHVIEGKDINTVIDSFIHINALDESQRTAVIAKIEKCFNVKKFYHKDCKFILHLQ